MAQYNISNLLNASDSFPEIFGSINEISSGMFAILTLFLVFILTMIGFKHLETKIGLLVSSLFTTLIAFLFVILGWIQPNYAFIPAILLGASLIWNALPIE